MAKEIPILIKVDGKELDAAKISVNDFNKIYSDTQKKLNSLPIGTDEWKKLNSELKNADKTFNQTKEILGEAESKFKSLKVQIRQATIAFQEAEEKGDLKGMTTAKKQLDDLNDQFELTTLKAMKFEDALATMPGVAGFVGQSIQGVDKAFKVLAANPVLAIVTALVSAFMFLKEAMGKTKEGQAALNKVSQAFSSVMGPILALINTVAVPIFEKLAMIIGKVGEAFTWFAEKLGVSKSSIVAATKDIDKVGQEAAEKEKERQEELKKQKEEEKQKRKEAADAAIKEAADKKKAAQETINDNEAVKQSEEELARAKVTASEDEVQAIKDKQAAQDVDYQRELKRINDLMKLEKVGSSEYKKLVVERNGLEKGYLENKAANTKDLNKLNEDRIKNEKELNDKVIELKIALIKDEKDREIASIEDKLRRDLENLEKDKAFIAKEEIEKEAIRKLYRDQAATAEQKVKDDAKKKKEEEIIKGFEDDLVLLQAQQKTLIEGTQAYLDNSVAIENNAYKTKLANAKDNAKLKEAIEIEHEQNLKNIRLSAFVAEKQILVQRMQSIASIGSSLQQLAGKNKALAISGIVIEKAAAIGQIWANNAIANAKAIAVSPLTFGQPWVTVNTVSAALSTAATIAAAAKSISEINNAGSGSGASAGESKAAPQASMNLGKNYAQGGMIGGKRHAEGGTMIEAEAGEAIMTRGAVTMFAPLLSQLNQMGGGTSFSRSAVTTSNDNPNVSNSGMEQAPIIVKSYVVSSDMTTTQEKNARLKDLSTL